MNHTYDVNYIVKQDNVVQCFTQNYMVFQSLWTNFDLTNFPTDRLNWLTIYVQFMTQIKWDQLYMCVCPQWQLCKVFQNKVPWGTAEGTGLCISMEKKNKLEQTILASEGKCAISDKLLQVM